MFRNIPLKQVRLWSQVLSFLVFCGGIFLVDWKYWFLPEELFFFLDPLVAVVTYAATGVLASGLMLSLAMVVLALVFGRFFCGWMCPLGSLIDFAEWLFKKRPDPKVKHQDPEKVAQVKFGVLVFVLAASFFSVQWIYFFDPMVIMTRFVGMTAIPVERTFLQGKPFSVLHGEQFVLFVIGILLMSMAASRFWCRFICPLGAFYGLLARFSLFDFKQDGCKGCPKCRKSCPTGAITGPLPSDFRPTECIRCFNCLPVCPVSVRTFGRKTGEQNPRQPVRMPRRTFLFWLSSGIAGSTVLSSHALAGSKAKERLRPPFAAEENAFLDLCVRCQACVNVCPSNALQPLMLQSGLYGLWSPVLVPSSGGCEPACNRCSKVCPTGAIGVFDVHTKYTVKMGTAHLDKSRCVSWADNKPCGKCIPKCPTCAISFVEQPDKKMPVAVDFLLCVGCGICENICRQQTLGPAALVVTAQGRNQVSGVNVDHFLKHLEKKERNENHDH